MAILAVMPPLVISRRPGMAVPWQFPRETPHMPEQRTAEHHVDDSAERLVVISDTHSHLEPLEALAVALGSPDSRTQFLVCGDLFFGGIRPVESLDWVMQHAGSKCVVGNHDQSVLSRPEGADHPFVESGAARLLRDDQFDYLESLPEELTLRWRGHTLRLVHGHRHRTGESVSWQATVAEQVRVFLDREVDAVFLGHTHFPYIVQQNGTWIANPGSTALNILALESKSGELLPRGGCGVPEFSIGGPAFSSFISVTEAEGRLALELEHFDYDREEMLDESRAAGQTRMPELERWVRTGVYNFGES